MARYLLNSPVLTAFGSYRFAGPLGVADARSFARAGAQSAIGHAATARWLSQALGVPVPCRRRAVALAPGDEALVLWLAKRLPEGAVLDDAGVTAAQPLFGLLVRES